MRKIMLYWTNYLTKFYNKSSNPQNFFLDQKRFGINYPTPKKWIKIWNWGGSDNLSNMVMKKINLVKIFIIILCFIIIICLRIFEKNLVPIRYFIKVNKIIYIYLNINIYFIFKIYLYLI